MAETDQSQDASDGSLAIQSARDTNITVGMSAEDMQRIMETLSQQLPTYAAVAREVVDARLADFKDEVLKKFADQEKADAGAFADPDFQYVFTRAQHAYARSGDAVTRDTVVDLIAKRSKEGTRSRLSLTLNDAVEKAAVLTKNEFAELSLVYLIRYTRHLGINSLEAFGEYCRTQMLPLLADISRESASYQYLQAHSCGSIEITSITLPDAFRENYAGVLTIGCAVEDLQGALAEEKRAAFAASTLVIPCLSDPTKVQLAALSRDVFDSKATPLGFDESERNALWNKMMESVPSGDALTTRIETVFPEIRELIDIWSSTPLKQMTLTTVGIAVGYANLLRAAVGFQADLGVWIK